MRTERIRTRRMHFKDGSPFGLCKTKHGKEFHATVIKSKVTCKICLYHLGMYQPPDRPQMYKSDHHQKSVKVIPIQLNLFD